MANVVDFAKVAFADTFSFYLKTHYYHWNVEGNLFPMIHEFFEKIYSEVYGAVDPFAEFIRTLGAYAPGTLFRLGEITTIDQSDTIPNQTEMISNLLAENNKVIRSLIAATVFPALRWATKQDHRSLLLWNGMNAALGL